MEGGSHLGQALRLRAQQLPERGGLGAGRRVVCLFGRGRVRAARFKKAIHRVRALRRVFAQKAQQVARVLQILLRMHNARVALFAQALDQSPLPLP